MTQTTRQRLVFIDLINVVAIIFVVFLHLRLSYFTPQDTPAWWLENTLSGFGVLAVPLFLMNTGVTVLDFPAREDTKSFFVKRALKVLVPYLIWGQLYLLFRHIDADSPWTPTEALTALFSGSRQVATLWYLEMLLGIYLVIPIVAWAITALRDSGRNPHGYVAGATAVAFFTTAALPTLRFFVPNFLPELNMPFGQGFLVYVLLGYLFSRVTFTAGSRILMYCAGAAAIAAFIIGGGRLLLTGHPAAALFTDYLSLGTVVATVAVFTAGRHLRTDRWPAWIAAGLARLSGLTFGIYLVHIMVMTVLRRWLPLDDPHRILSSTVIVWVASLCLVALLRLLPSIKRWVLP